MVRGILPEVCHHSLDFDLILQRISIRDILESQGIRADRNRIPCPIHGGSNPTAFSIQEHTFHCFSCDAHGGLIDLLVSLRGISRNEAVAILIEMAGLNNSNFRLAYSGGKEKSLRWNVNIDPDRLILDELRTDLKAIDLLRKNLTVQAKIARRGLNEGTLPLVDYYTKMHYIEYAGEEYDREYAKKKNEITMKRRVLKNAKRRANN